MNVLYKEIEDRCTKRIDNGEKYTYHMWFEEAENLKRELRKECLFNTAYELEEMISAQKYFKEV